MVAIPTIELANDTGASGSDDITSDFTFQGTADPGATITIDIEFGGNVASTIADANGDWSVHVSVGEGEYTLTATATDSEGVSSDPSDGLTFTYDATAPTAQVAFADGHDANLSAGENTASLVFTFDAPVSALSAADLDVTGGTVHSFVEVPGEGGLVWTAVFEADGSDDLGALGASVAVKGGVLTDTAGNSNAASSALSLYGDTSAPATPTIALETDTGEPGDGVTAQALLTGTGTPGSYLTIYQAGEDGEPQALTSLYVGEDGTWSLDLAAYVTADVTYSYTASATDFTNTTEAAGPVAVTYSGAAPGVSIGFGDGSGHNLDATTNTAGLVFTFTEAVQDFTLDDLDVAGGTVTGLASSDGGLTWTAVFTADTSDDLGALGASVTVKQGAVEDGGGSQNDVSNTINFYGDTNAPVTPTIALETDTGEPGDGVTAEAVLTGTGTPGSYLTVYQAAEGGEPQALTSVYVGEDGTWSLDLSHYVNADVAYSYSASATDFTNATAETDPVDVTYSGAAPSVSIGFGGSSGHYLDATTNTAELVFTFNEPVSGFTLDDLDVVGGTVTELASNDGGLTWTAVFTADSSDDIGALGASVTVKQGAVEDGGASQNDVSNTISFYGDTQGVDTPTIALQTDTGEPGDGMTSQVVLTGTGTPGSTITIHQAEEGGEPAILTYATVGEDGTWSSDLTGYVTADTAYTYTATASDGTNTSAASDPLEVTLIDETAPDAPAIYGITDDTGSASYDGVTKDTTPAVYGTAEAGSTVEVFLDGESIGTAVADGSGSWSLPYSGDPLSDGSYSLTATATDPGGNTSAPSWAFSIVIDTDADMEEPIDLTVTAPSVEDGDLSAVEVNVAGIDNDTVQAVVTFEDQNGHTADVNVWTGANTVNLHNLGFGENSTISTTLTVTDTAGNVAEVAGTQIEVGDDSTAPLAPSIYGVSDDTGSGVDGVTNDTTPGVYGVAESGSTVEVFIDGESIGTAVADASGNWSVDHTGDALADGGHEVTATATDASGNASPSSSPFSITIDTDADSDGNLALVVDSAMIDDDTLDDVVVEVSGLDADTVHASVTFEDQNGHSATVNVVAGTNTIDLDSYGFEVGSVITTTLTATDVAGNTADATGGAITVDNSNEPPTPVADTASAGENETVTADVLANDGDPEGDGLSVISVAVSSGQGTASIVDGQVVYNPGTAYDSLDEGETAEVVLTYTVEDDKGAEAESTLTITLAGEKEPIEGYEAGTDTPADLIAAIVAPDSGITVDPTSIVLTSVQGQTAFYDGSLALGIGSGIVLTSGVTPGASNTSTGLTGSLGLAGDQDLTDIVSAVYSGNTVTRDAAILEFSFTISDPNIKSISFDAIFGSEEYPEYVDSFVDIAAVIVNGVNYANFNKDADQPLSVLSTNLGNFINNGDGHLPIEYDGLSQLLAISAPVNQGVNTIKIAIADTGDFALDSGIFISNLRGTNSTGTGGISLPNANDAPFLGPNVAETVPEKGSNADTGTIDLAGAISLEDADPEDEYFVEVTASSSSAEDGAALGALDVAIGADGLSVDWSYSIDAAAVAHLAAGETRVETFTIDVRDREADGLTDTATITITITGTNDGPVAVADTASADEHEAITIDVLANDTDVDDGAVLTLASASVADGQGSVAIEHGEVAFDAGADFDSLGAGETAEVTITYTIEDEHGAEAEGQLTVTVTGENDAPVAEADEASGEENEILTTDVLANDTDADDGHTLTLVDASAPDGQGTASIVDGKLVFDPGTDFDHLADGDTAEVVITYTIEDEHGGTSEATVTVTVTPVNDAPQAAEDAGETAENETVTIDVLANDSDAEDDALTLTGVSAPTGQGTASVVDGKVVFDPGADFDNLTEGEEAEVVLTYTVEDEHGEVSEGTVTVMVVGTNDEIHVIGGDTSAEYEEPETPFGADPLTGTIDFSDADLPGTHSAAVVAVDGDDTGVTFTAEVNQNASGNDVGQVGWTAEIDTDAIDGMAEGETRTLTYTLSISDDFGNTVEEDVTITITGTNDAPVAEADEAAGGEHEALTIDVLGNDSDGDAGSSFTLVDVQGPADRGTAAVEDGKVVFDPGADFDGLAAGETAEVVLTYTIADEHGAESQADIVITVAGENDAPVAQADDAEGGENETLTIDVLSNDTDADTTDLLTLVGVAASAGQGSASIVDGQVVFDPGADFDHLAEGSSAEVILSYTMRDESGAESEADVTVTVTGENDAPEAAADEAEGDENETLTIDVLANDTDADNGHTLTLIGVSAPGGQGAASVVGGKVVFDPGADFDHLEEGETAEVTLTYTIADEHGEESEGSVTVTLAGSPDGPVIAGEVDGGTHGENDGAFNIDLLDEATDPNAPPNLGVAGVTLAVEAGDWSDPIQHALINKVLRINPNQFNSLGAGETLEIVAHYTVTNASGEAPATARFTIEGENDGPTGLTVSNKRVDENATVGTVIGTLAAIDPDRGDSFSYELTGDASGFFDVVGDKLVVAPGADLDFETATSHNITVLVTDDAGASHSVVVKVDVRNLNGVTILGTTGADTINVNVSPAGEPRPTREDDTINAGAGNDNVQGLDGNDAITGGTGDDILKGGNGNDTIDGGAGRDNINGDAGNDIIVLRGTEASTDILNGGAGTDRVKVAGASAVTLTNFDATAAGIEIWEGNDRHVLGTSGANDIDLSGLATVTKLDYVDAGAGNDTLMGSAFDDELRGGIGNDTLGGGAGKDILIGGLGKDAMIGGTGADVFDFNALTESVVGANRDTVTFVRSEGDRIDLSGIDADTDATAGNQAFKWVNASSIGAAFTGVDGQLRFSGGILMGDTNGDKKADFEIKITGALTSVDVIL